MSISLMTKVWADAPFDQTTLLVLLALADNANDDGTCWPSVATIATKARCTERWCRRVLDELEEAGWLARTRHDGRPSTYRVMIPTPGLQATPVENTGVASTPGGGGLAVPGSPGVQAIHEPSRTINEPSGAMRKRKAPHLLPADFVVTAEMQAWAKTNVPQVDLHWQGIKFANYYAGKTKLDWPKAWRNWMLKAAEFERRSPQAQVPTDVRTPLTFRDPYLSYPTAQVVGDPWAQEA